MVLARVLALRLVALLAVVGAVAAPAAGAGPSASPSPPSSPLARRLDAALDAPALRGARLAALVVDRASGEVLYARDPDRPLVPASNLKVLTGVAALAHFGPAHRFTTRVLAPAPPDADGAVAWLAVRGGGDPALTSEQWWRLAADLRAQGLRRVRGDLIVDGGAFDAERWHPGWAPLTARAYHAPVGGLAANYGAFKVVVEPGASPGAPVRVRVDPPVPYFDVAAEARTAPPGGRHRIRVDRETRPDGDRVRVSGTLPRDAATVEVYRSVSWPARYAGAVLRMQLEANGVRVDGAVRAAPAPASAHELLAFEGHALATIARLFLKNSNNMIAEALVKAMALPRGQDGSAVGDAAAAADWSRGLAVVRDTLSGLGLDPRTLVLVDGSGLARANRVPVRQLVAALRAADRSFAFGPELLAALPLAAADGTLERRADAAAGAVRAKTGLLSGVTGLSGFARAGEREVVFSVLANGYRAADGDAMAALDGFAAALVAPR
ncbi:MAG: D-alanyl-D-alanine carboxypeptidase/D-alanyl-D-alanine-endopeptidase [Myxococcota bacterium]|nr:D-alanyl-D-alanine carboxypeptidase/D-alanyl-D-alanine-endopeptidase [Myxococcota bacterium]